MRIKLGCALSLTASSSILIQWAFASLLFWCKCCVEAKSLTTLSISDTNKYSTLLNNRRCHAQGTIPLLIEMES